MGSDGVSKTRHLALDDTRLGDSFEAWLAVLTPHGPESALTAELGGSTHGR